MIKTCDNCNHIENAYCKECRTCYLKDLWEPIEEEKMCETCKKSHLAGSDECLAKTCIEYAQWEARDLNKNENKSCDNCFKQNTNQCKTCDELSFWFPQPSLLMNTPQKIDTLFNNFKEFLKEKNKRYGDSALKPQKIFSKQDSGSQICNRIDDKLGRINNSSEIKKNDLSDLFGYVALLLIEKEWLDFEDLID